MSRELEHLKMDTDTGRVTATVVPAAHVDFLTKDVLRSTIDMELACCMNKIKGSQQITKGTIVPEIILRTVNTCKLCKCKKYPYMG